MRDEDLITHIRVLFDEFEAEEQARFVQRMAQLARIKTALTYINDALKKDEDNESNPTQNAQDDSR